MELSEILPANFAIITNELAESREIGKIIEKHYPYHSHSLGWNADSIYAYGIVKGRIDCEYPEKLEKQGVALYTLEQIKDLLGEKPKEVSINNTYSLY